MRVRSIKELARMVGASLVLAVLYSSPAAAGTVAGAAQVIDGDTVEIGDQRIRLFGIDAPELSQTCERDGAKWECGKAASDHLRAMIGTAELACNGAEKDTFGRLVAVCRIGSVDLNREIVAQGWATAFRRYSEAYLADETRARAGRLGLWSSSFISPEEYRTALSTSLEARTSTPTASAPRRSTTPTGCVIKGNHSRRGDWIYHLPGMPYYEETRAEAIFCSEAQAQAAGYRRSKAH